MAVDIAGSNPIVVSGTTTTNDAVLEPGMGVFIKFVKWHSPDTIGHKANLQTGTGHLICKFECEVADESQYAPVWSSSVDIYCNDLDSGELHIYIR